MLSSNTNIGAFLLGLNRFQSTLSKAVFLKSSAVVARFHTARWRIAAAVALIPLPIGSVTPACSPKCFTNARYFVA